MNMYIVQSVFIWTRMYCDYHWVFKHNVLQCSAFKYCCRMLSYFCLVKMCFRWDFCKCLLYRYMSVIINVIKSQTLQTNNWCMFVENENFVNYFSLNCQYYRWVGFILEVKNKNNDKKSMITCPWSNRISVFA